MPSFGQKSRAALSSAHPFLQLLFEQVVADFDCSVTCGHRGEADQDKAFEEGKSQVRYSDGKHNKLPSNAVDVVAYPIDWGDSTRQAYFAGQVMAKARSMGIPLRWGGDWDGDTDLKDQDFDDLVHFELLEV